jgi:hypothetical protein
VPAAKPEAVTPMRGVIAQKHPGYFVVKNEELGDKIILLASDVTPPCMNNLSIGDEVDFDLDLWRVIACNPKVSIDG